jgi:uncharacterized damage-inducible protein DinB
MIDHGYVVQMARYNAWMNDQVFEAAAQLTEEALMCDRQAFFGSLFGTLSHIAVADTVWLKRFADALPHSALAATRALPMPQALNTRLFNDLANLGRYRQLLDQIIKQWAAELTDDDLSHTLHYTNMQGVTAHKPLGGVLMHFFNHQTHHRGQATTLLTQAGQDVGVTDLITLIPNL